MPVSLQTLHDRYPAILMAGAIIERLPREPSVDLDPHLMNTAMIYSRPLKYRSILKDTSYTFKPVAGN